MNENEMSFATVVVTYGSIGRFENLLKTIMSALEGGAKKIYLIDNGCSYDLKNKILDKIDGGKIDIVELDKNYGSLVGFSTGLQCALSDSLLKNSDYVLILDDDVILDKNFLKKFVVVERKWRSSGKHIWSLFREGRDQTVSNVADRNISYYQNSVAGFSIFRNKLNYTKRNNALGIPFFIPWAGTFLKKSELSQIDLPAEPYFVYEDDAAFSLNARDKGFDIYRSYDLKLFESSNSWFEEDMTSQSGYKLFYDGHAYPGRFLYKVRNNISLVNHRLITNKAKFIMNLVIFILAGFVRYGRLNTNGFGRLWQLCSAVRDGLNDQLGENKSWKL